MSYTIEYELGEKEAHLSKAAVYLSIKDVLRNLQVVVCEDTYYQSKVEDSKELLTHALEELEKFHPKPRYQPEHQNTLTNR
jgi:hypothetical protein